MSIYEVRVPRHRSYVTPAYAVRRARHVAHLDRVQVIGEPQIRTKRSPIPVIGPRRVFVVTFPEATRAASEPDAG